jgi:hypothetical protein
MADVLRGARETAKKIAESTNPRDTQDYYLVLVFPDGEAADKFIADNGLPDNRFQNGEDFAARLAGNAPMTEAGKLALLKTLKEKAAEAAPAKKGKRAAPPS